MTSYFEKLTSINTSSLNLHRLQMQQQGGGKEELSVALDKIEELKSLNCKLELDLKCEHDEKVELVGLKVGLENEVLNLREVNQQLEFQVEQLRVEKDKIHYALAKVKEEVAGFSSGGSNMKKFPSLDDLSCSALMISSPILSPCGSPTAMTRICTTPTAPLERITEEDETLLESLVVSRPDSVAVDLQKRILVLEEQNSKLRSRVCSRCRSSKKHSGEQASTSRGVDSGILSVGLEDEEDDAGFGEEFSRKAESDSVEDEINVILDMQRKIIGKLETELNSILQEDDAAVVSNEVSKLKIELERKMNGIMRGFNKSDDDDDDLNV